MITCSAGLKAHLSQPYQTTAQCWLVELVDGSIRGFTTLNANITFDLEAWMLSVSLDPPPGIVGTGSVIYLADSGYTPSDIAGAADLSPDNMEADGVLVSPSITEPDLNAGVWDFCSVTTFIVNYENLSQGALILRSGKIGEVTVERGTYKAEIRGVGQAYSRIIGELLAPLCRADLGDRRCKVRMTGPLWQATTGYTAIVVGDASLGSVVQPTVYNGRFFNCTTAGTSGGTEPAWNTTVGGTTNDGGVVWTTIYARTVQGTLTGVGADNATLFDSSRLEPGPTGAVSITAISKANPGIVTTATALGLDNGAPITQYDIGGMTALNGDTFVRNPSGLTYALGVDTSAYPTYTGGGKVIPLGGSSGFFDFGVITFVTGLNAGLSMEVKSYVPGQITLQLPMPYQCAAGDTYTMTQGCNKALQTCKVTFGNILNMRAEPYLPGIDRIVQVGKQQ